MSYSRHDLVEAALLELGIAQVGQSTSAEDHAVVNAKWPAVVAYLRGKGVVSVATNESVSDEFYLPLTQILASHSALSFGLPESDRMELAARAQRAENDILTMNPGPAADHPVCVDYF